MPMPIEPGGFVVRLQSAAAPPVARIVPRARTARPSSQTTPATRPSASHRAAGARRLEHLHVRVAHEIGRQLAHDAPAGGAAAGVDDPPARVAALEPEREVAGAVGVKAHAQALELADQARRLVDEDLAGGGAHQPAAGALGVLEVQLRRVVDRERRREAALRPVARRLSERRGADDGDAGAALGRGERRIETGRAGPDDDDVHREDIVMRRRSSRGTVLPTCQGSCCATTPREGTTRAPIPSGSRGSSRSSRCWPTPAGSAARSSTRPTSPTTPCTRCTPRNTAP